jgi:hypothetical protein
MDLMDDEMCIMCYDNFLTDLRHAGGLEGSHVLL